MTFPIQRVNKPAVARAFSRAAGHYDEVADFQRLSGKRLLARLPSRHGLEILDAGCGTGYFSRHLTACGHRVTALDLAPGMLARARQQRSACHYLQADIERLPLSAGCVDLCFCNLSLQWCASLPRALAELMRVTRRGGRILFATLADGSLAELDRAWQQVDGRSHVNRFPAFGQIAEACAPYRHRLISAREQFYFPDVLALMRALKGIGATHLHGGRAPGLSGRQQLARLAQVYPRDAKGVGLSYQLVIGDVIRE